jgi:small subunit ribosomal protein S20
MPHTRSAKKQLRKNLSRRGHNRSIRSTIRTLIKKVFQVAESGDLAQLQKEVKLATKKLDKAAAKRVVHPNLAARKKSQMARLINQKSASTKGAAALR